MNRLTVALIAAFAAILGASVYTLDAREIAVVTQFGAPVRTVLEPGLYFRAPWPLHEVHRYDSRSRLLDVAAIEVLTQDKKNLVVEAFAVWRVQDPLRFLEAVGTPELGEARLADLVVSRLAASLGRIDYADLLAVRPQATSLLPEEALKQVRAGAADRLGIDVQELRLRHLGLPLQNEQSIYERMRAERRRIANAYRSEGEEEAIGIRAKADRQAAEILAGADKEAAVITARAEEAAARLYAQAYAKDPAFYRFLRSLDAAEAILDADSVLVIEPDHALLKALTLGEP
jgi:membrane protease subunit HflC